MRRHDRRAGTTVIEILFFSAIASIVIIAVMGLLSRGTNLFTRGRQISASQNDLRIVLEYLSEDAAELVFLDVGKYDSGTSGTNFSFVTKSSRKEKDLDPDHQGLRRVVYTVEGSGTLKSVTRAVTLLDEGGNAIGGQGPSSRTLVRDGIKHLKIWGIAALPKPPPAPGATPLPGPTYSLKPANPQDPADAVGNSSNAQSTKAKGTTVACLVVDISAGEAASEKAIDKQSTSRIVTRLWCRNRILEVSRGALK